MGAEMSRVILRRLRMDNDTTDKVCRLVRFHDYATVLLPTGVLCGGQSTKSERICLLIFFW